MSTEVTFKPGSNPGEMLIAAASVDQAFEGGRPRTGGRLTPLAFSEVQSEVLNAVADELIPPGDGFPAPSEVGIVEFIGRYVAATGEEAVHYPFAAEDAFKEAVDALGSAFVESVHADRVRILEDLEKGSEEFFEQLRSLVYYGYYSRPAVILAIQRTLPAGRDYHGPPQPYGYIGCIESWDESLFPQEHGGYVATADVQRLDLSNVTAAR